MPERKASEVLANPDGYSVRDVGRTIGQSAGRLAVRIADYHQKPIEQSESLDAAIDHAIDILRMLHVLRLRRADFQHRAAGNVRHGIECVKRPHDNPRGGYLHGAEDDTPYVSDDLVYCGRCHEFIGMA